MSLCQKHQRRYSRSPRVMRPQSLAEAHQQAPPVKICGFLSVRNVSISSSSSASISISGQNNRLEKSISPPVHQSIRVIWSSSRCRRSEQLVVNTRRRELSENRRYKARVVQKLLGATAQRNRVGCQAEKNKTRKELPDEDEAGYHPFRGDVLDDRARSRLQPSRVLTCRERSKTNRYADRARMPTKDEITVGQSR